MLDSEHSNIQTCSDRRNNLLRMYQSTSVVTNNHRTPIVVPLYKHPHSQIFNMVGGNPNYEDALRRLSKVVNSTFSRADCGPFREPVDWRGLELYDYPKIIKKMMDLGTVKRKLERNQYKTAQECADDIRQIWTNCKTYNADGSDFYLLAEGFSKRFEDRYKKIQAEFDTGDEEGKASTQARNEKSLALGLDVKTKFASNLFLLSGMEIGHVIQVLDLRCPQALDNPNPTSTNGVAEAVARGVVEGGNKRQKTHGSNVEINVEAIDGRTFGELDRYVKEKMLLRSNGAGDASGGPSRQREGTVKKK